MMLAADASELVSNAPAVLQQARQWIPWKAVRSADKVKKAPVDNNCHATNSTNPKVWMWFDQALDFLARRRVAGVGIALPRRSVEGYRNFTPLLAVDVDWKNCGGAEGGRPPAHLEEIIEGLNSYTEWSPSRKGAHVLVSAALPTAQASRKKTWPDGSEVSLMAHSSYATFTGLRWADSSAYIHDRQDTVNQLFAQWWPDEQAAALHATAPIQEETAQGARGRTRKASFVIDWKARVSEDDVKRLIQGVNRTPDQVSRMAATWEKRRTPGVVNAEYVFTGDHSVSMYLKIIVREVMFLAPRFGWNNAEQRAADFAVAFAKVHAIPRSKVSYARIEADIAAWRKYAQRFRQRDTGRDSAIERCLPKPVAGEDDAYPPPPHPTVSCGLCCDITRPAGEGKQSTNNLYVTGDTEALAGNTAGATVRVHRRAPSREAVLAALAVQCRPVKAHELLTDTQIKQLRLSRKALLMQLGRLVQAAMVERRNHRYRLVRQRNLRRRKPKPFPVCEDGRERVTISRTELVGRGWSRKLIDAILSVKDEDYISSRRLKPGTKATYIEVRYYFTSRVKDEEAAPEFEQKRYQLRTVRSSRRLPTSSAGDIPVCPIQSDHQGANEVPAEPSQSLKCA